MYGNGPFRDCIYIKLDPNRPSLDNIKNTLKQKQARLEELKRDNQQYPSEQTEKQIAKVQEIIARLQNTIVTEQERGKR